MAERFGAIVGAVINLLAGVLLVSGLIDERGFGWFLVIVSGSALLVILIALVVKDGVKD